MSKDEFPDFEFKPLAPVVIMDLKQKAREIVVTPCPVCHQPGCWYERIVEEEEEGLQMSAVSRMPLTGNGRFVIKRDNLYRCKGGGWSSRLNQAERFDFEAQAWEVAWKLKRPAKVVSVIRAFEARHRRDAELRTRATIETNECNRIAEWLDAWRRLNEGLLLEGVYDTSPELKAKYEGIVWALGEIAPRIRDGKLAKSWKVPT
jgi:hypothetical protein